MNFGAILAFLVAPNESRWEVATPTFDCVVAVSNAFSQRHSICLILRSPVAQKDPYQMRWFVTAKAKTGRRVDDLRSRTVNRVEDDLPVNLKNRDNAAEST
jgi:hypothetical protein